MGGLSKLHSETEVDRYFATLVFKICKYRYLVAWLRKRENRMEGNQHLRNNHHFPGILVAPVKSSSPFLLLRTLTTASFLSILGQNCSQNNFEYQIILKDLKIHYVKFM